MRSLILALLLGGSALAALKVPFAGWAPSSDPAVWQSAGGQCVLREQLHDQAFAPLPDQAAANTLAARLQQSLLAQKFSEVSVQTVQRGGAYGLLASYLLSSAGGSYRVTQLYLSDAGKLRTLTGSVAEGEQNKCAADIQNYLRYLAD